MKNIQVATGTDFGSTSAERVQGGKTGILYVDSATKKLKLVYTDGALYTAQKDGGTNNIIFVAD